MIRQRFITRCFALKDMCKAGIAVVVFGAACTSEDGTGTTLPGSTTLPPSDTTTSLATTTTDNPSPSSAPGGPSQWARVNMGFVSAYILYREGEAALVDTGQSGAEGDIEAALQTIGLYWGAVTSVIVTHRHPDHAGSVVAVAGLAPNSSIYAGAGDIDAIGPIESAGGTREPIAVGDDDSVFGLDIIETPGHTVGHISVLDAAAGILVTGDAMNTNGGTLNSASADPQFTRDPAQADESVRKLAGFDYDVILVGHGGPITEGGAEAVSALAADL